MYKKKTITWHGKAQRHEHNTGGMLLSNLYCVLQCSQQTRLKQLLIVTYNTNTSQHLSAQVIPDGSRRKE